MELKHLGTATSGRYPKGSGEDPNQRHRDFKDFVDSLKKQGLTRKEIATACGINTKQLSAKISISTNEIAKADIARATDLLNQGLNKTQIGREMGRNESSIRALLEPSRKERTEALTATADILKAQVEKHGLIDVGAGSEIYLRISRTKLQTSLDLLAEEGYTTNEIRVQNLGMGGDKKTTVLVLAPPGVEYKDIYKRQSEIKLVQDIHSEDGGKTFFGIEYPKSISSDRVAVKYAEQGGADKDGVIELRRGVEDISLGDSKYAQVRIAVDGTHYLKGMAIYSDNLPKGVDILFNSNKSEAKGKLGSLKPLKDDPDNPFGAVLKELTGQRHYIDSDGKEQLSVINKVNEEGDWEKWNKSLSSQMLSKQPKELAKAQLGLKYDLKKEEYDEIMSLTNPAIKKKLLDAFADGCDSSAVHLKAAAMPRQAAQVILPLTDIKDNEIYAPNFHHGEPVILIRYPHGGTFEIPSLIVNNNHPNGIKTIGQAKDAVGISPKTAAKLSGADFDGDSVLVIPNKNGNTFITDKAQPDLQNFDPKVSYKGYPGIPKMKDKTKGLEMGKASNLITDMTIAGAPIEDIILAVRHSMVVIDAQKNDLDYKQSFKDHEIGRLKKRYQSSGASTLISRAASKQDVGARKDKPVSRMTPEELVDHKNGKKIYEYSNETYIDRKLMKNGTIKEIVKPKTIESTKMFETDDAFNLSSGTQIEGVYATHANKLKALGNLSRKNSLTIEPITYSPEANVKYKQEVNTLKSKLLVALKNAPLERQASLFANTLIKDKRLAYPDLEKSELKKMKSQALTSARARFGAKKERIPITDREWEAIQAGAITKTTLNSILNNTDLDVIKQLATPRTSANAPLTPVKEARIKAMLAKGNTQREIADQLGVSLSTVTALI